MLFREKHTIFGSVRPPIQVAERNIPEGHKLRLLGYRWRMRRRMPAEVTSCFTFRARVWHGSGLYM